MPSSTSASPSSSNILIPSSNSNIPIDSSPSVAYEHILGTNVATNAATNSNGCYIIKPSSKAKPSMSRLDKSASKSISNNKSNNDNKRLSTKTATTVTNIDAHRNHICSDNNITNEQQESDQNEASKNTVINKHCTNNLLMHLQSSKVTNHSSDANNKKATHHQSNINPKNCNRTSHSYSPPSHPIASRGISNNNNKISSTPPPPTTAIILEASAFCNGFGAVSKKRRKPRQEICAPLKWLCFILNFLVFLIGVTCLALGVYLCVKDPRSITEWADVLLNPAVMLTIMGLLICIISLMGSFGALRDNITLLKTFSLSVFFCYILIVIFTFLLFILFYSDTTEGLSAHSILLYAIKKYHTNRNLADFVDYIQEQLECCGVSSISQGYRDWQLSEQFNCSEMNPYPEKCGVPFSCCRRSVVSEAAGSSNPLLPAMRSFECWQNAQLKRPQEIETHLHTRGCLQPLRVIFESHALHIGAVVAAIIAPVCISVCLSNVLAKQIDHQRYLLKREARRCERRRRRRERNRFRDPFDRFERITDNRTPLPPASAPPKAPPPQVQAKASGLLPSSVIPANARKESVLSNQIDRKSSKHSDDIMPYVVQQQQFQSKSNRQNVNNDLMEKRQLRSHQLRNNTNRNLNNTDNNTDDFGNMKPSKANASKPSSKHIGGLHVY
ncbi:unnamed protein product [Anisakis simplex]|uniref:Tetraspanin n=1 Tax=Anisakis simplex TaxID=6269 RepID=A0A0M3JW94_ANISI|nr:unnamed protein product [Anisakis simplex]